MNKTCKVYFIFLCFLLICLFSVGIFISESFEENTDNSQSMYLKVYDGRLALFGEDNSEPLKIYETFVSTLPQLDREKLKNGIRVESEEELNSLLEDFED